MGGMGRLGGLRGLGRLGKLRGLGELRGLGRMGKLGELGGLGGLSRPKNGLQLFCQFNLCFLFFKLSIVYFTTSV